MFAVFANWESIGKRRSRWYVCVLRRLPPTPFHPFSHEDDDKDEGVARRRRCDWAFINSGVPRAVAAGADFDDGDINAVFGNRCGGDRASSTAVRESKEDLRRGVLRCSASRYC